MDEHQKSAGYFSLLHATALALTNLLELCSFANSMNGVQMLSIARQVHHAEKEFQRTPNHVST